MIDDPIAHLDFTPESPQCECHGDCGLHAIGARCPHIAQYHTKIHAFGFCKQPGLTERGQAVHIVCAGCMLHYAKRAQHLIEKSHVVRERLGAYLCCTACRVDLVDVNAIWEARPLDVI